MEFFGVRDGKLISFEEFDRRMKESRLSPVRIICKETIQYAIENRNSRQISFRSN